MIDNNRQLQRSALKEIFTFLVITFALSWAMMGYIIFKGGMRQAGLAVVAVMWVPGIVSLLYRLIAGLGFKDVGWKLGPVKYWGLAFFVPLLVAAIAYSISWITGVSEFISPPAELLQRNHVTTPFELIIKIYPISFLFGSFAALGEELGWRGFLIPKLYNTPTRFPLIVSALIWGVWHFPLILWGGYASSSLSVVSALLFTAMILVSGVFVGWLRMMSGSVWVAMIYHAAHNLFLQTAFEVFNKPGPQSELLAGESGVIPCAVYIAIFFVGWRFLNASKNTHSHMSQLDDLSTQAGELR